MRHHTQCNNDNSGFLAGAIIGGLIGAGAALLLAPQSGEKTRKDLKEKKDKLKVKANLASKEARDKIEEVKENVEDEVSDVKHKAQTAAKNLKEEM